MIYRAPATEPAEFEEQCRQPGNHWLANNPTAKRPRDYWSPFLARLADAFGNLCAYGAMYEPKGTVDHFQDFKNHREMAYEWTNYRHCSAWINSSKKNATVLDPFLVEDGWFEILLPSLQLVLTEQVPDAYLELARNTLRDLHLQDDERVVRQRRTWYQLYQSQKLSLEGLLEMAPLIGRAVQKALAAPPDELQE